MQRIHLVGIGGSGMSAIAKVLWERGYSVTGSDQAETSFLAELRKLGIPITVGHKAENIQNADLVLRTSAATANNPEVKAALDAGIPVMRREEYMRILLKETVPNPGAGAHRAAQRRHPDLRRRHGPGGAPRLRLPRRRRQGGAPLVVHGRP
ncbi:MAG TPA: Mur ligase domain-containing protein, partial [Bellilinea sp.]|nr:Mur ligase domain-containing protein [Bellilinea sp.]